MKKFLTFLLIIVMTFTVSTPAFASTYSNGWNGGEKINFTPLKYHTVYSPSDSLKDLTNKYGIVWYESPTRFALKGEVMLLQLRTIQASLKRQGYKQLSANGETLTNFKDRDLLVSTAEDEVKVLKAIGVLSGDSNSYMNMDDYITRAEVAKIVSVTNQSVLGIPVKRSNNSFTDISNNWARDYISQAYGIGVMDGVTSSRFYPDNVISIEQILDILDNEVGYYGITEQDVATAMNETLKITYNLSTTRILADYTSYNVKKNDYTSIRVNVSPYTSKDLEFSVYDESVCKITSTNQYTDTITILGLKVGSTYVKVNIKGEPSIYTIIPVYVTSNDVATTGITINSNLTLEAGDSYYLTATVLPYNATNKAVKYYSSDSNVAMVDSNGRVTGNNKGAAVITAETYNGFSSYCVVTVTDQYTSTIPATGIVTNGNVSIEEGYSYYLETSVLPYNATNKSVVYYSDNSNIATVSSTGRVTGVSQGVTVITAQTHNGYQSRSVVTVTSKTVPATGITITSNVNLKEGNVYYLTTSILPYNATDKTVKYYSSDTSVARVNSDGKITARDAGTTVITAETHNGYKAYCYVTVTENSIQASGITVTSNLNLKVGYEYYLNASVSPYNATNKTIIYYSSDTGVARVDSSGKVTGVSKGVAVITLQTHNGYTASCVITVTESVVSVTGITVNTNLTLKIAERQYITATVSPYNATDKTVKYYSDDTNIASVNSNGRVTGINKGVTVVTAESQNGYKAYCVVTVNASDIPTTNPTDSGKNIMYVSGYGESSYYNAFNNESMTFIVDTSLTINDISLSNDNCYLSQGASSNAKGWQFTVKSRTLSQNGETLLTVTLSNGEKLTVRICIYP
ncbi:MAG: hypothetical protein K0R72_246 [Clostridia bacterium]|jgi:uncharacterized protein YjdB|nr:hypothetical protein [Clostridia bacterium]